MGFGSNARLVITPLVCGFLIACNIQAADAADDKGTWRTIVRKHGIAVEIKESKAGDDRTRFRGVGIINASPYHIFAILHDVSRYPEWSFRCSEAKLLRQVNAHQLIIYVRLAAPWPFSDRDTVMLGRGAVIKPEEELIASFEDTSSTLKRPVRGVIRFPRLSGRYRLQATAKNRTRVTYEVEADPGGWIPEWLSDMARRELPLKTILGLRKQAARAAGAYSQFIQAVPTKASDGP
jgi:hypothetical protein